MNTTLLLDMLAAAVPLEMMRLADATPEQLSRIARESAQVITERGDVIQFKAKGTANATAYLIRGLAVMALTADGGVTFAGRHWCVDHAGHVGVTS